MVLVALSFFFDHLINFLVRTGTFYPHDVPMEILDIIPIILTLVAITILIVSTVGIIAAVGVLKRKEWARILMLIVSFFNLIRIPLGTIVGVYSLWVLFNDETIHIFNPVSYSQTTKSAG